MQVKKSYLKKVLKSSLISAEILTWKGKKPIKKINYSIIVIDEAQDMNKLYYKFLTINTVLLTHYKLLN